MQRLDFAFATFFSRLSLWLFVCPGGPVCQYAQDFYPLIERQHNEITAIRQLELSEPPLFYANATKLVLGSDWRRDTTDSFLFGDGI
jgi:hypothetical protein